jgi:hypothetical protein
VCWRPGGRLLKDLELLFCLYLVSQTNKHFIITVLLAEDNIFVRQKKTADYRMSTLSVFSKVEVN